jgi:hypothetical protein
MTKVPFIIFFLIIKIIYKETKSKYQGGGRGQVGVIQTPPSAISGETEPPLNIFRGGSATSKYGQRWWPNHPLAIWGGLAPRSAIGGA